MTVAELFSDYRKTKDYDNRLEQTKFCSLAREIIVQKLQMEKLRKQDLTGFIQMFAWRGENERAFSKYFDLLGFDPSFRNTWIDRMKESGAGYTAVGKTAITKLSPKNSMTVKTLLVGILNVKEAAEAKEIVEAYERIGVPEVTSGVFSPWLHYLQPQICPIVNGPIKKYLRKLGWDGKYSTAIDYFQTFARETGETDLGIIDSFFWKKSSGNKFIRLVKQNSKRSAKDSRTIPRPIKPNGDTQKIVDPVLVKESAKLPCMRYEDVRFHFITADEEVELVGSVLLRDRDMIIDIQDGRAACPYLIVGKVHDHHYKGMNSIKSDALQVKAHWASIGDAYVGLWVEDGSDYYFSFRIPD